MPLSRPGKCVVEQITVVTPFLDLPIWNRSRNQSSRAAIITEGKRAQGIRRGNQASGIVETGNRTHSIERRINHPAQFVIGVNDGVVRQGTVYTGQLAGAQSWVGR